MEELSIIPVPDTSSESSKPSGVSSLAATIYYSPPLPGNIRIKDLSPLLYCKSLMTLDLTGCLSIQDLSPISSLKKLNTISCLLFHPHTSLLPLASCTGLKELKCNHGAVDLEELKRMRPEVKISQDFPMKIGRCFNAAADGVFYAQTRIIAYM